MSGITENKPSFSREANPCSFIYDRQILASPYLQGSQNQGNVATPEVICPQFVVWISQNCNQHPFPQTYSYFVSKRT